MMKDTLQDVIKKLNGKIIDGCTLPEVRRIVSNYLGDDTPQMEISYDPYSYIFIEFIFEDSKDAVAFKLKYL